MLAWHIKQVSCNPRERGQPNSFEIPPHLQICCILTIRVISSFSRRCTRTDLAATLAVAEEFEKTPISPSAGPVEHTFQEEQHFGTSPDGRTVNMVGSLALKPGLSIMPMLK